MFLLETEAKIIENTLRRITWAIDATRTGNIDYLFSAGQRQGAIYSLASLRDTATSPASYLFRYIGSGSAAWVQLQEDRKTVDDLVKKLFITAWKEKPTDDKTSLATSFFELELINAYVALYDGDIKEQREVQKILFSTRDKKLEESIKYIDQMYDENDNSFEKRLAAAKIEGKMSDDQAIEISHKNAINSAFRILTLKLHPDKGGDAERFKVLQEMRDHLLYVDLEHEATVDISRWNGAISSFQVGGVEQDFQVLRKLLQGKSIPKIYTHCSEKTIKKMADDGVHTSPFL